MSDDITFNDYQEESKKTARGFANPEGDGEIVIEEKKLKALFLSNGINGETGELAEKIKKYVREDDEKYLEDARAEFGDVLWYMAQLASLLDEDLSELAGDNIMKLLDREERDVIFGEGDER